ncbi:histone H1 [Candidatus Binatus sp.]|uniref:histone H1 n=1 Tax=Candidatus Binatus sp. TaxID=2811406 RepID=UPI003CC62666
MKIATGEVQDDPMDAGKAYNRKGGLKGGVSRAKKPSAKKRAEIARKAARGRWSKSR